MIERRILVADDEKEIVELLRKFFATKSYIVDTATSPAKAIDKIETNYYPVVITDINFPGKLSGMDILHAAKKRANETKIIMITGYGSIKSAVESMKLGAYDYITKPFDFEEMMTRVERIFELADLAMAYDEKNESLLAIEKTAGKSIYELTIKLQEKDSKLKELEEAVEELAKNIPASDPNYEILIRILKNKA